MAIRAGAAVADLEFCQFHPTVLQLSDNTPFLVSEAVRGEGAYLRDKAGNRFMVDDHELAELAPRDVVARGIQKQMVADGMDHVFLDLRHLDGPTMRRRFPTISRELEARGLDLSTDLIPVAPAAHYFMGGVVADEFGTTSLPGLLAVGEAACTGVHGANRLASNSLLEGLVFGRKAAQQLAVTPDAGTGRIQSHETGALPVIVPAELEEVRAEIRQTMSRYVSVVRDADGLKHAIDALNGLSGTIDVAQGRAAWVTANMTLSALAIATAALRRQESRGAHYRSDFPDRDPKLDGVHFIYQRQRGESDGWRQGALALAIPLVHG